QDGVQTPSCAACTDRLAPGAGLSSFAAAFYRTKRVVGVCPNCGTTQDSAIETGLVGCPLCYEMLDNLAVFALFALFAREQGFLYISRDTACPSNSPLLGVEKSR